MFKNTKIALFSDLHIGVHKNHPDWHKVSLQFGEWFVKDLTDRGIRDIVFCGDYFHTRHEIEQTTLRCGIEFLSLFKNFNIIMLPGNHCCYFKSNAAIHSLEIFKPWDNVTVLDNFTCIEYKDKRYAFCPWGAEDKIEENCDIIFGHFELANFKMNTFKICEHGYESKQILKFCKKIVTGHFHLRDHRIYDNGKEILYLGSPFQMDFGEREQVKGYTILDTDTLEFEFVENTVSPKHIKIKLSELININAINLKNAIKNNILQFYVDKNIDQSKIQKVITTLTSMAPLQFRVEYNTHEEFINQEQAIELVGVDVQNSINEFIENITVDIDKKEILKYIDEVYKKCLV